MLSLFGRKKEDVKRTAAATSQCAPGITKMNGSCLPREASKRRPQCKTDRCVALGHRTLLDRLRPEMPEAWDTRPRTYLNTLDIDNVMFQYESAHPFFKYVKTLPIDAFERSASGSCISNFCDIDPQELAKRGKTLIGMVLNLDKHYQSGSHWVMAALDMRRPNKPELYYYDSFARSPPVTLMPFFRRLLSRATSDADARKWMARKSCYNSHVHQRKNTECGVFSMLALEALIHGVRFKTYCSNEMNDDDVQKERYRFFDSLKD